MQCWLLLLRFVIINKVSGFVISTLNKFICVNVKCFQVGDLNLSSISLHFS